MWTSCPKINYKLWCKLDKSLKNNRVTKRIDINRQYCDYLFTLSKYKKAQYCQNHSRRFHIWYKTHTKTLNIGKNTTA